ncbi:hypothetical protein O7626_26570 [Micromonospora sp. WMMD1102]|uniref:ABC transporter permease n=1 Tax=Micromonospora sp. WMMD1102 TaxID=3016105 RepID=UPI0024157162|nr:ABC transporter permease [Micromonospora sp. WMMD1102]MDG4789445.1 hypothetical protein [Micromonospora sp. WMMD1102]
MTAPAATAVRVPVRVRVPGAIAVADFRERVRRPAYAMVLATAVGLGYLAVPAVDGRWVVFNMGDEYRGVYNSAYVGTVTALAGALWLAFAGFYVVRGAVVRDERTRVGELLAATPLSRPGYLLGKFLSNLLVLGSMLGVLAGTAVLMQLARGEDRAVDPVALLLPFGLLALPVLAVTAAAAVLFETVRPLRTGFGNVVWFFLAMIGMILAQDPDAPLGGLGVQQVAGSIRARLVDAGLGPGGEFSLGLMYLDAPLRTIEWSGFVPDAAFVGQRLLLGLIAVGMAVLPALWFGRFDPARAGRRRPAVPPGAGPSLPVAAGPGPAGVGWDAPARPRFAEAAPSWIRGGRRQPGPPQPGRAADSTTRVRPGGLPAVDGLGGLPAVDGLGRLLGAELRVLRRAGSRWWWLGVLLLALAGGLAPLPAVSTVVLPLAWIWPVLLWSRLGTRSHEYGLAGLLGAYPALRRRMLAEWLAGVTLAGLTGLVPMLRMLLAVDAPGLAAWGAGALFVPSLAYAAGILTRTERIFQVGYLAIWYLTLNGVAAFDVMGAVRVDGRPAGPVPLLVAGCALALLGLALLVGTLRHSRR